MAANSRTRRAIQGPEPFDIEVGANVRTLRKHRRLSQQRLAAAIGVTFQQLQKYEKGENRVSCSKLKQLSEALGVSMATILGEADSDGVTVLSAFCPEQLHLAEQMKGITASQQRMLLALIDELRAAAPANG